MDNLSTIPSSSSSSSSSSSINKNTNTSILLSTTLDPESERVKKEFAQGLEKLTFNCKNTITSLTEYARLRILFAQGVVSALEEKIISSPADKKLPLVYLLDSIVKNIGPPYLALFSRNLKLLFLNSYESQRDEKLRNSFKRVLQTWRIVFPPQLIRTIEESIFGAKIPANYSQISPQAFTTLLNQTGKKIEESLPQTRQRNPISAEKGTAYAQNSVFPTQPATAYAQGNAFPIQTPKSAISPQLIASLQSLNIPLFSNTLLPTQLQQQPVAAPPIKNAAVNQTVNITLSAKAQKASQKLPSAYLATSEFVGQRYQDAHWILYRSIKSSCASCGLRFPDTPAGKQRLSMHLDWHYKRNRRIKDKCKRPISRDWFPTEFEWKSLDVSDAFASGSTGEKQTLPLFEQGKNFTSTNDASGDPKGPDVNKSNHSARVAATAVEDQGEAELHFVPTRLAYDSKNCSICGEKFKLGWNEDSDEWVYENAVLDEDEMVSIRFVFFSFNLLLGYSFYMFRTCSFGECAQWCKEKKRFINSPFVFEVFIPCCFRSSCSHCQTQ
jgi:pre-mRNA cleavage complex 2 protein Pcf11